MSDMKPMRPVQNEVTQDDHPVSWPFMLGGSLLGAALFVSVFWWSDVGAVPVVIAVALLGVLAAVGWVVRSRTTGG